MRTIAISSGHGKYVSGAVPPYIDEVTEARKVVAQVASDLKAIGATVRGPFNDDVSTSQNENLNRIVNWHNKQSRDLDVSVHFNANMTTSSPVGTECWYVTQKEIAAEVASAVAEASGLKDRGPKHTDSLFFLNSTSKPAVLIEVCFVDSKADVDLYKRNFDAICAQIANVLAGEPADVETPPPDRPPIEPPGERPPPIVEPPPIERPPDPPLPAGDRPVLGEGDNGPYVAQVQRSLGLPDDGDFGPATDAGVSGFQRAMALSADGVVGEKTWAELDTLDRKMQVGDDGIDDNLAATIDGIVENSSMQGFSWPDRGEAPDGYYAGMAKTFALAALRLRDGAPYAVLMAQADRHAPDTDALSYYASEFRNEGMDNSQDGVETLRHLFVMMVGLGMRESSGNHWEGRDMSASNVEADTCEAGLMQTSWNMHTASSEIVNLFETYMRDPNGFRPTFTKGLYPTAANLDVYGSGDGAAYQWLAKYCPAFAVLMTGIGLRLRRSHWGPINGGAVDIEPRVDDMLVDVQRATLGPGAVA